MTKRLYRSRNQKLVGGVLGGLSVYFGHDPIFWRLGFIILLAITGVMPFVLVYLVAWVLIPEEPLIEPLTQTDYNVKHDEQ